MIFVTLVCVGLTAWQFMVERPRRQRTAFSAIFAKGVDLKMNQAEQTYTVFFRNQNVIDEDLDAFVPAFTLRGGAKAGSTPIRRLNLNGSVVSAAKIEQFEKATGVEVQ
jgi:hypothetical protein